MANTDTNRKQLISEVEALRRHLAELDKLQVEHNRDRRGWRLFTKYEIDRLKMITNH